MPSRAELSSGTPSTGNDVSAAVTPALLLALFVFGGAVIRGFTSGLIWGVVIGTYSSIALAVPLLASFNVRGAAAGGDKKGGESQEDAAKA